MRTTETKVSNYYVCGIKKKMIIKEEDSKKIEEKNGSHN